MKKALIAGLVLVVIAAALWYGNQDQSPQPAGSAAASGEPMVKVARPPSLTPQARQGEDYYDATCATCHGADAAGQNGVAPPLVHKIYEPSHHGDWSFVLAVRNGVRAHHWQFGDMPPVDQPLTDAELGAIITYIRELQRANGIH